MSNGTFFDGLLNQLPEYATRKEIGDCIGNFMSPRYLANLDCIGKGPTRVRMGRRVVYKREDLIAWLQQRVRSPK